MQLRDGGATLGFARPDPSFRLPTGLAIHPAVHGHVTVGVADLEGLRARLPRLGVAVVDDGPDAVYCFDPACNVVCGTRAAAPPASDGRTGWHLHHVNVPAPDLPAAIHFYEHAFAMQAEGFPGRPDRSTGVRVRDGVRESTSRFRAATSRSPIGG